MTEEQFLKKLGKKIEECRENVALSRQAFAERIGISRMQIYRIETGSSQGNPSILVLRKIAKEVGLPLNELLMI